MSLKTTALPEPKRAPDKNAWIRLAEDQLEGERRIIANSIPYDPKADAESVYVLVIEGVLTVDAELYRDAVFDQRRRLARFAVGAIFFLPAQRPKSLRIFLSGKPTVSLRLFGPSDLTKLMSLRPLHGALSTALANCFKQMDGWEAEPPPPASVPVKRLTAGNQARIRSDELLACKGPPVWLKATDALEPFPQSEEISKPEYRLLLGDRLLRQGSARTVQVLPESFLDGLLVPDASQRLIEQIELGWDQFTQRWQRRRHSIATQAGREAERLRIESSYSKERLTGLLSAAKPGIPETSDNWLRAAFFLIAEQGWQASLPRFLGAGEPHDFLARIAASSGLILRDVTLEEGWWQKDFGPLLVTDSEGQPRVAQPHRGGYRLWDPETEKTLRTNAGSASKLTTRAYSFHRQLPAKALTLREVLFFELGTIKAEMAGLLLLALLAGGLVALIPMASAFVVQTVISGSLEVLLQVVCLGLIGVGLFQVAFAWAQQMLLTRAEFRLDLASTIALWHRILHFPTAAQKRYPAGDLAMRIDSFIGLQSFFRMFAQSTTVQLFTIVSSLVVIFSISLSLALFTILFSAIALTAAVIFSYAQVRAFLGGEKSLGIVNSFVLETYNAIHKVKAAGAEAAFERQWAERFGRLRQKLVSSQKVGIRSAAFQTGWGTITTAVLYFVIVHLIDQQLGLAAFIAFTAAYATLSINLRGLCGGILEVGMQVSFLKFIDPLMKTIPELRVDRLRPDNLTGRIRIEGLFFSYPGSPTPALQNINIEIPASRFTVILGASGSGKSTLARLISGLETARGGHIFLDDYDIQTVDQTYLREHLAIVPQDFQLIPGTLLENLRGASRADLHQIIEAAKLACLWDDIEALPMGVHTLITGSGTFSGGQMQRIALARALLRRPRILVLDEITSALDNELQARIVANLKAANQTVILIAHRLSLAQVADQIIVLHGGQVAEKGTESELRESGGHYARMLAAGNE